jgi:recombination protein RecT
MSTAALKTAVTGEKPDHPIVVFRHFLDKQKNQIAAALPKHIHPDRMIRLACTEFAKNKLLHQCTELSVYAGIIQAAQLGLEIGVLGQGYLIPFWNNKTHAYEAQFIPDYKEGADFPCAPFR